MSFAIGLITLLTESAPGQTWRMQPLQIPTKWASAVGAHNALPECPHPQLVRQNWQNLNGLWDYAITPISAGKPSEYDGSILNIAT